MLSSIFSAEVVRTRMLRVLLVLLNVNRMLYDALVRTWGAYPFFNLWLAWRCGPNDPRFILPGRNRKIIAKRPQQAHRVAYLRYL